MDIEFFKTESEPNRLEKILTDKLVISGEFKEDVNIINPILSLNARPEIAQSNYIYIPNLNRYYFIDRVEITQTNIYTLYLSLDVLMSYKEQIKELKVILKNSTANPYYNGFLSSHDVRKDLERLEFENNFNEKGTNVLIAINGADRI